MCIALYIPCNSVFRLIDVVLISFNASRVCLTIKKNLYCDFQSSSNAGKDVDTKQRVIGLPALWGTLIGVPAIFASYYFQHPISVSLAADSAEYVPSAHDISM